MLCTVSTTELIFLLHEDKQHSEPHLGVFVPELGWGNKEWKYPAGMVYAGWDLILEVITLNWV